MFQAALSLLQREKSSVETWLEEGPSWVSMQKRASGCSGYMELRPAVRIDRAVGIQLGLLIHRNKAFWSLLRSEQGPEAQALSRWLHGSECPRVASRAIYQGHVRRDWETVAMWPRLLAYRNSTHTSGLSQTAASSPSICSWFLLTRSELPFFWPP